MNLLDKIRELWQHAVWADSRLLDALREACEAVPEALREYAHIIGAEEVWLARIQQRSPRAKVWPAASIRQVEALRDEVEMSYRKYLASLGDHDLSRSVTYTNSAGQMFTNTVGDILLHVALHGQYHRGKVNLLLRQAGHDPAPTDYIAFVRGVAAATDRAAKAE